MYQVENGDVLNSHQQAQYGFFQSLLLQILHLIFQMYLCWVISFSLAGEPKIMKWFCRGSSITFSFFFCIYQIRGLQMEVSPPHILCTVMATMLACLSVLQHLFVHKTFSKEPKGFWWKVTQLRTKFLTGYFTFYKHFFASVFREY